MKSYIFSENISHIYEHVPIFINLTSPYNCMLLYTPVTCRPISGPWAADYVINLLPTYNQLTVRAV